MDGVKFQLGETARLLGCMLERVRIMERRGRVPPARCHVNGHVYTKFDIAQPRSIGVGSHSRRLKWAEEVLDAGR